jgi:hypothetical protein
MTKDPIKNIQDRLDAIEQLCHDILDVLADIAPVEIPFPDDGQKDYYINVPVVNGKIVDGAIAKQLLEQREAEVEYEYDSAGNVIGSSLIPVQKPVTITVDNKIDEILGKVVQHHDYFNPTLKQLSVLLGYTIAEPFRGYIKTLRDHRLITVDTDQRVSPTPDGIEREKHLQVRHLPFEDPLDAFEEWKRVLPRPCATILDAIYDSNEDVPELVDRNLSTHKAALSISKDHHSMAFKNYLSVLKGNSLVRVEDNFVYFTRDLFMNLD